MKKSPEWRFTTAVFLVSAVTIIAEIAFMRELALRFWSHLAWLVVSIALLGFGASGTMLILVRRIKKSSCTNILFICLAGCALSLTSSLWLSDNINVNLIQMAWQPATVWSLGLLELSLTLPFIFGGLCIAAVLEDMPARAGRNYAASFLGSGAGGLITPWLLYIATGRQLICTGSLLLLLTALLFTIRARQMVTWLLLTILLIFSASSLPHHPTRSEDKEIPQIMAMQGSTLLYQSSGPQGMVEVIKAPAFHGGPGTALLSTASIPPHNIIGLDGHFTGTLYTTEDLQDFQFMDHTTSALPFHLLKHDKILIMEPAGNGMTGLALFHEVTNIDTISTNRQIAGILQNHWRKIPVRTDRTSLRIRFGTARQALRQAEEPYSLITLPATGYDLAGLAATEPDPALTTETIELCFNKLREDGLLSVTTQAHLPPRESLRLVNLMAHTFGNLGLSPAPRLIVIRNWATVSIIASRTPFSKGQLAETRQFCTNNGFDLVWLADLQDDELNRYHIVGEKEPAYNFRIRQLLSAGSHEFTASYFYKLSPPDNNKPFFHNFQDTVRISNSGVHYAPSSPSFQEIGTLLLWVTLVQTIALAFILIAAPLIPAIGITRQETSKVPTFIFFASIGLGFMLLELGMMQLFTSYLAHPVWASSTVLSAFLLFAGVGSSLTALWTKDLQRIHLTIISGVLLTIIMQTVTLDLIRDATDHYSLITRIILVYLYLAPLAVLLGMVFPIGIKRLGKESSPLIPWGWCVNGCASVTGALAAPLIAMQWGFDQLLWTSFGCYVLGGICSRKLTPPETENSPGGVTAR